MSNVKLGMSGTQIEPLKDVKCCLGESPVDKCFEFKYEWNSHKSLECNIVDNVIAIHEEITLLHLCNTISYLKGTYPEVTTVKKIEYYECPVVSELIACNFIFVLTCFCYTIRVVLEFDIAIDWEIPEHE